MSSTKSRGTESSWWTALKASIDEREKEMIAFRRDLHAHPESSGNEFRTTERVLALLKRSSLAPRVMDNGCGMVVDLDLGAPEDSIIAIRADMDCVQVQDQKKVPWQSRNDGCCHACGHDAHTSMALFSLLSMHEHVESLRLLEPKANIRVLFQPAEEDGTGAQDMIKQHALDGVRMILALHVDPYLEAGHIGLKTGPITANLLSFQITIEGKGGHSARPFQSLDPIPAAVNMVSMMYQLGPRSMDSRYPLSLTVTSIHSGKAYNAIPDSAEIRGTLRTSRDEDQEHVKASLANVVRGLAATTGCTAHIEFPHSSPATNNDVEVVEMLWAAAEEVVGRERVSLIEMPSLGGEDFAYFQQIVPGAMARLGAAFQDPSARFPLHSPLFDINEASLVIGSRFLSRAVLLAAMEQG